MGNELVETMNINGQTIEIIGCWDSDTPENEFDFFDIYENGTCLNEGDPFYDRPSIEEIQDFLELFS